MKRLLLLLFCLLALSPLKAVNKDLPALLTFGVGVFDVLRDSRHRTAQYSIEYKWSDSWHSIQPLVGIMGTNQKSLYIYGGFSIELLFGKHVAFSPSFAPGIYFKGDGKDLGYPLEFRSAVALAYVFKNHSRLGLQFYHMSNANLGDKNPGSESLVLFYSLTP